MNRVWGKAFVITGLILMLGGVPSWGAPPNNDDSDAAGNTAGGTGALQNTTTGGFNTADGLNALFSNTTGSNNTASGGFALFNNTTGDSNTASGLQALFNNTTGGFNTADGLNALFNNTTGSNNIAVGVGAGEFLTSGDNNIYLGNFGIAAESNTMRLGASQTNTFIAGVAGVPVNGSPVLIDPSTGQLGIQASSIRYKRDIQPMGRHSRGLFQLRPVIFRYKQDAQDERQYGLIAEEVAKVYPELVTRNAQGEVESVRYQELTPMLLNELQHQQREVIALQAQNARLQATVEQVQQQAVQQQELQTQNGHLRATVGQLKEQVEAQQAQNAALAARLELLEAAAARASTLASR
jgi:hypothetical protein